MPSRTGYSLTPQQHEAIYGVIVECCGAPRDQQKTCLAYLASSGRDAEWRFEGWLGLGGKLYANSQGVYVDCYSEQKSPIVAFAIGIANTRIAEIIGGDYPTISATLGPCSRLAVEEAAAVVQEALDREMPHLHAAVGGEFAGARRARSGATPAPGGNDGATTDPEGRVRRLEAALIECAVLSGEDMDGDNTRAPTCPPIEDWAVECVKELREEYDEALREALRDEVERLRKALKAVADWIEYGLDLSDEFPLEGSEDEVVGCRRPIRVWVDGRDRLDEARTVLDAARAATPDEGTDNA